MNIRSLITDWATARGIPTLVCGIHNTASNQTTYYEHSEQSQNHIPSQFGIGSITKSMTALGVLTLAESGELSLTDPVSAYIDWEDKTDNPVEVRHLLSHSSGRPSDFVLSHTLRRDTGVTNGQGPQFDSFDTVLSFANEYPASLCQEPETAYQYYNTGYIILGLLIETVTDNTYSEYMRKTVLNPLGMDNSQFVTEDLRQTPQFYDGIDESEPVDPALPCVINPAGGLFCPCDDILIFGRMLNQRGVVDETRIFSRRTIERLIDPVIAIEEDETSVHSGHPVGVATGDSEYALGIEKKTSGQETIISHHGNLGYAEAQLTITDGFVIVSLANCVTADGGLHNLNLCLNDILNDDKVKEPYHTHTQLLDTLKGVYSLPTFDQYTVSVERNGGYLEYTSDNLRDGILLYVGSNGNTHSFREPLSDGSDQQHQFVQRQHTQTQLFLERHALLKQPD